MHHKLVSLFVVSVLYALPICGMDIILSTADIEAMGGLRAALDTINSAPDSSNSITIPFPLLTNQQYNLPPIEITNGNSLIINGQMGGTTLDGLNNFPTFGPFRGFFVSSGNVTINNLNFTNTQAIGGNGGNGLRNGQATAGSAGGGGMGAGGALFVKSGTTVTLKTCSINTALAQGGAGGDVINGGDVVGNAAGGGGGGMGGHGGSHIVYAETSSGAGG